MPAEHFLIFLLMTGMFYAGGFELGMSLSAWRLLVWIIILGIILLRSSQAMSRLTTADLPIVLYGLFLLWCLFRLTEAPSAVYGARNFFKLLYPFLVMLLARKAARPGHLGVYLVPMIAASLIISIFTSGISEKIPYLYYNPLLREVFWHRAAFAEHAAIMVGVILVTLWTYKDYMPMLSRKIYLIGLIFLILSPFVVTNRTGILATAAAISGYALVRYRVKAVPVISGLFFLGIAAFVFLPGLRENTFYNTTNVDFNSVLHGNVEIDNIDSSGRFALWGNLLDRFYKPNPLIGSGLGAVQQEMYSNRDLYGVKASHSEYVILLCDTGLVGLLLYILSVTAALYIAVKFAIAPLTAEQMATAAIVISSFLACLCAMGFDNIFIYTLPVHSLPFAFTGILLGIINNSPINVIDNPWMWSRVYVWSCLLPTRKRPMFAAGATQPSIVGYRHA